MSIPDFPRLHGRGLIEASAVTTSSAHVTSPFPRLHGRGLIEASVAIPKSLGLDGSFRDCMVAASLKPFDNIS